MAERNTKPASSSNANATVVRPSNSGSKSTTLHTTASAASAASSLLQQQTSQATQQSMHISAAANPAGVTTVSNLSQMAKILPQIVDGIVIFTIATYQLL